MLMRIIRVVCQLGGLHLVSFSSTSSLIIIQKDSLIPLFKSQSKQFQISIRFLLKVNFIVLVTQRLFYIKASLTLIAYFSLAYLKLSHHNSAVSTIVNPSIYSLASGHASARILNLSVQRISGSISNVFKAFLCI